MNSRVGCVRGGGGGGRGGGRLTKFFYLNKNFLKINKYTWFISGVNVSAALSRPLPLRPSGSFGSVKHIFYNKALQILM